MKRALWIVCPVFHDVESFMLLRERLLASLGYFSFKTKFIVVDDSAGQDDAVSSLRSFYDVTILTPARRLGHQRAIVFGLRNTVGTVADKDIVVTLDADGEDRPEDLPRILDPVLLDRNRVALATRTSREASLAFKSFYLLYKALFRICTGLPLRSGNYAAFSGVTLKKFLNNKRFDFSYSSSLLALKPLEFVACRRGKRYVGRSKMNAARLVAHGLRLLLPFSGRITLRAFVAFSVILAGKALF